MLRTRNEYNEMKNDTTMQRDVIIACDFKSAEDTFAFLDLFRDEARKPFL